MDDGGGSRPRVSTLSRRSLTNVAAGRSCTAPVGRGGGGHSEEDEEEEEEGTNGGRGRWIEDGGGIWRMDEEDGGEWRRRMVDARWRRMNEDG